MEPQNHKLFVGGITCNTDEEALLDHFRKYGEVENCEVLRHRDTGFNRGFAFIIFSDPSSSVKALKALRDEHVILGKRVEVTIARPKVPQELYYQNLQHNHDETSGNSSMDDWACPLYDKKKIFVGGLPSTLTQEEFKEYFKSFGTIEDAFIVYDRKWCVSKGFGFVTFDSEEAVKNVLSNKNHVLNDKIVDVKKAILRHDFDYRLSPLRPFAWDNRMAYVNGLHSFGGVGYSQCLNRVWSGYVSDGYYYGSHYSGYGCMSFPNIGHHYYSYFHNAPYMYWNHSMYSTYTNGQACFNGSQNQKIVVSHPRDKGSLSFRSKGKINENCKDSSNACDSCTDERVVVQDLEAVDSSLETEAYLIDGCNAKSNDQDCEDFKKSDSLCYREANNVEIQEDAELSTEVARLELEDKHNTASALC